MSQQPNSTHVVSQLVSCDVNTLTTLRLSMMIAVSLLLTLEPSQQESALTINCRRPRALTSCMCFLFTGIASMITAGFAKYVFDYHWSWGAALMFGSIVSATDPVAVVAILKEVGEKLCLAKHHNRVRHGVSTSHLFESPPGHFPSA